MQLANCTVFDCTMHGSVEFRLFQSTITSIIYTHQFKVIKH